MRVLSVLAGSLAGILLAGSAMAAADCSAPETPAAQLICRDAGLSAAAIALETALSTLGDTTDAMGRTAIEAGQTLWRARRDESCPVTAADLADDTLAKSRSDCLLRAVAARIAALEAERAARGKPVADLPVVITEAAAPRLVAVPPRPAMLTRPVSTMALIGRWAKADPINGSPIDDCRVSYLDVTKERTIHLLDPRIPGLPIEGRFTADADPAQGVALTVGDGVVGEVAAASSNPPPPPAASLKLEAAETPRRDRLVLRMEAPATFAATFVRCR